MDLNLLHHHKVGDEPSNYRRPPECCVAVAAKAADKAVADAEHAERRRVVLEALDGIEAYWHAVSTVLPSKDPGTLLAAKVVEECLRIVGRVGCICPMVDVSTLGEAPGSRMVPGGDPRCGVHGGERPRTVREDVPSDSDLAVGEAAVRAWRHIGDVTE